MVRRAFAYVQAATTAVQSFSEAASCLLRTVLFDMSQLLQTGLDRETLTILVGLTESGVNPEALAAVVKELRRESAALSAEPSVPAQSRAATEAAAFNTGR